MTNLVYTSKRSLNKFNKYDFINHVHTKFIIRNKKSFTILYEHNEIWLALNNKIEILLDK